MSYAVLTIINSKESIQNIIVVELVVVLQDFLLDGGRVYPADVVLELAGYEESRLCYDFCANADVALLDECYGFFHGF